MTEPRFRTGDRVRYRAGGPVMHVIECSTHLCYCNWVDDFGLLQQGTFEQRNLTHAAAGDPAAAEQEGTTTPRDSGRS